MRGKLNQFSYLCEYLRIVKPKLCITLIDTTPHIYRIKAVFPEIRTISIQNGWRGYETIRDFEKVGERLFIDHMLCFGLAAQSNYSRCVKGAFHPIGSFRSNKVPILPNNGSPFVSLISTLRSKVDLSQTVDSYSDLPPVSHATIFERRLRLAQFVAEFCLENSLKLNVVGKDFDFQREEHLYREALSPTGVDWTFSPRTDLLSSYKQIDGSRIVVSTSSSLGYEALGRGIRTAFFMLDPEVTGNFGDRFGWPEPLEDSGEIWTNFLDRKKTLEILYHLQGLTDDAWSELRHQFVPRMISSDPGNMVLKSLINNSLGNS